MPLAAELGKHTPHSEVPAVDVRRSPIHGLDGGVACEMTASGNAMGIGQQPDTSETAVVDLGAIMLENVVTGDAGCLEAEAT